MKADPKPVLVKKQRKPAKKKSRVDTLISDCDDLIRKILPLIEAPFCVTCGGHISAVRKARLCVGHYHRRGRYWIRWDLRNVHRQCDDCNCRHEQHPYYYENIMNQKYSQAEIMEITRLAKQNGKIPTARLEEIKNTLTRIRDLAANVQPYHEEEKRLYFLEDQTNVDYL